MRTTRRGILVLATTLFGTAALAIGAAPAGACGMIIRVRPSPEQLLVSALDALEGGKEARARAVARELIRDRRATLAQRARAHAVLASASWEHDRRAALAALADARSLDGKGEALEAVLARLGDRAVAAAIRQAFAA